jgi:Ser/Thr protein kinase RdoA (MazF antagonist)
VNAEFVKRYDSPAAAARAMRHHRWLAASAPPMRQPRICGMAATSTTFEHVTGRHARAGDLRALAGLLGDAHGAAWDASLRHADLRTPHPVPGGRIEDYLTCRRAALRRRLEQGFLPGTAALRAALALLEETATGPAAFYKDSNPRNFLITTSQTIFVIDTDDLTLAPFGYDLAKLIVTLQMTYGSLRPAAVTAALDTYNQGTARHGQHYATTLAHIDSFAALHQVLNAPYAGRHGYRLGSLP